MDFNKIYQGDCLELMKENALHTAFELERKANKILVAEKNRGTIYDGKRN